MITSILLKNWRSHKETKLEFVNGTNVLVGSMGSGKSSVLDAIVYALFGNLPSVKSRRIRLEDLIMDRPELAQRTEVEVGFRTATDEEYVVKRCIERGRGTVVAELGRGDGELIEAGSSERVTERVCELLQLTYDVYERAIYSEQNKLDQFLEMGKGKRKESIDELLGIKRFEKARRNMVTLASTLQRKAVDLDRRVQDLKRDEFLSQVPKLEQEVGELIVQAEADEKKARELESELGEAQLEYQRLRRIEREFSEVDSRYAAARARVAQLQSQVSRLREKLGPLADFPLSRFREEEERLKAGFNSKKLELQKRESELSLLKYSLGSLKNKEDELRRRISELEREVEEKRRAQSELERNPPSVLESRLQELKERKRRLESESAVAKSKVRELEGAMEELSRATASCPVCEAPLDEARKGELLERRRQEALAFGDLARRNEEELGRLDAELARKEAELRNSLLLQREAESLPQRAHELTDISAELQRVGEQLNETSARAKSLEQQVDEMRGGTERLGEELLEIRNLVGMRGELADLSLQLAELEREKLELKKRWEELQAALDRERLQKLDVLVREISAEHARMKELARRNREVAEEKRRVLEEIRKRLQLIQQMEAEAKLLRELSQLMGSLQAMTSRVQTELRKYFMEGVNGVMNEIWEDLYPYGDFVGIKLAVDEGEGDYVLKLRDRLGEWKPVEGGVSGGERSTACLALRVAFAMVLAPSLRWIVFDEPTHNLDTRGVEELAKVLRERLPGIVKQVLLITHNERLEEAVSGYLYRFYRDKAKGEPTRYEMVALGIHEAD